MIRNIEEIETSKDSYPFASAEKYCELSKAGYRETEYYMRGTANVYETVSENEAKVVFSDAPYVNRFVVRAPEDKSDFSGNVVVEIINPTSFMEIDRMWIFGHREFVRSGDIYVGITSKPNTIAKMREFDEKRYGCLEWKNPREGKDFDFDPQELQDTVMDLDASYEPGLFWDMLTDLARLLRSDDETNPIKDYGERWLYLTGWSQSACYMTRYVNTFAYSPQVEKDGRVFDGYLSGGVVRSFVVPLNQYEAGRGFGLEYQGILKAKDPFIDMQTESENGRFMGYRTRIADSDDENLKYRYYTVTGASHDTQYNYVDYYRSDEDLIRIDHLPEYNGKEPESNNYPSEIFYSAAFRNLFGWTRTGRAPASCPRIPVDSEGENKKDAFGNTIGGLRTCLLDYPTGRYRNFSTVKSGTSMFGPWPDKDILFGSEESFSQGMIKELYGDLENYRKLAEAHTETQVAKGFVLKEDAEALVAHAVERAKKRGLR